MKNTFRFAARFAGIYDQYVFLNLERFDYKVDFEKLSYMPSYYSDEIESYLSKLKISFSSWDNYFNGDEIGKCLSRLFFPTACLSIGGKTFQDNLVISSDNNRLYDGCRFYSSDDPNPRHAKIRTLDITESVLSFDRSFDVDTIRLKQSQIQWAVSNFKDCTNFIVTDGSMSDVVYNDDTTSVLYCCKDFSGRLVLPNTVGRIENKAFRGCTRLQSIDMPSVRYIGYEAFSGCESLNSVSIPDSCCVDGFAFRNCTGLEHLVLNESLYRADNYDYFYWCPDSSLVKYNAFNGCTKLVTAGPIGEGSNIEYAWPEIDNKYFKALFPYVKSVAVSIDSRNTVLDTECYSDYSDSYVFDPAINISKLYIDYSAGTRINKISPKTNVSKETVFDEIHLLPSDFFKGSSITELVITGKSFSPKSPVVFRSVKTLVFGDKVCEYSLYALSLMNGLQQIICSPQNSRYTSVDGVLFSHDGDTLLAFPADKAKKYEIPGGTKVIADGAFANSQLLSLTIPSTVTAIGSRAFAGCNKLKTLRIETSAQIEAGTFYDCTALTDIIVTSLNPSVIDFSPNPVPISIVSETVLSSKSDFRNISSSIVAGTAANDGHALSIKPISQDKYNLYFDLPELPSGSYGLYVSVITDTADAKPYYFHPTITGRLGKEKVTIMDPSYYYKKRKVQTYYSNDVNTLFQQIFTDTLNIPSEISYITLILTSSLTEKNVTKYNSGIIIDEFLFCPKDSSDVRWKGPFSFDTYSNATLHVPSGKEAAYQSANGWNLFGKRTDDSDSFITDMVKVAAKSAFITNYGNAPAQGDSYISISGKGYERESGNAIIDSRLVANANSVPGFLFTGWSDADNSTDSQLEFIIEKDTELTGTYHLIGDLNYDGSITSLDYELWQNIVLGQGKSSYTGYRTDNPDGSFSIVLNDYYVNDYYAREIALTDRNFDIDLNGKLDIFDYYILKTHADNNRKIILPYDQSGSAPVVSFSISDLVFDNKSHFSETPLTLSWNRSEDARIRYMEFDLNVPNTGHGIEVIENNCVWSVDDGHYCLEIINTESFGEDNLLQFIFPDVGISSIDVELKNVVLFDENYGVFTVQGTKGYVENPAHVECYSDDFNQSGFYDLQGRPITEPQSGLYIQNGKVIFIK